MEPYPSLGLSSLAAWVRERGLTVAIADGTFLPSIESLLAEIGRIESRLVGVFAMNSFRGEALAVVRAVAETGRTVICGGPDPSIYPDAYLEAGARAVAHSEGELILVDVARHFLKGDLPLAGIPGISFLDAGRLTATPPRPPVSTLDELPLPAHDLADLPSYLRAWKDAHGVATINIMTSRGCPFRCNWCARPIFGKNYRLRRIDAVLDEMKLLVRHYGVDHFWIFDDTFVVRKSWVEQFCEALKSADLAATFECMARVDQVNEKTLHLMKEAGCSRIYYGVESGSQKVLDAMEKGTRIEQIRRTADWMHALDITMGAFIMYGYPGEEYSDILQTLALVRSTLPDELSVSVAHPMPGTGFYDNVRDELLATWAAREDYHEGEPVFQTRYPAFYYRLLKERTHAEWRDAKAPGIVNSLRAMPWRAATSLLSHLPSPHHRDRSAAAAREIPQG